jgi:hypothetical protein
MKPYKYLLWAFGFNILYANSILADTTSPDTLKNNLDSLIIGLGISTLACIVTTLVIGFLIKKNRKILLPWHRTIAVLTLVLALSHAIIVLISG